MLKKKKKKLQRIKNLVLFLIIQIYSRNCNCTLLSKSLNYLIINAINFNIVILLILTDFARENFLNL